MSGSFFNENSVDPDPTPRSMASDLDLHCLPVCLLMGSYAFSVFTFTLSDFSLHNYKCIADETWISYEMNSFTS